MLNFCDFIQVYVFSTNHHLNYRFDRISYFYQSVFEIRYEYFGKMKCCILTSVEYILYKSAFMDLELSDKSQSFNQGASLLKALGGAQYII